MTITVCSGLSKDVTELGKHETRNNVRKMEWRGRRFVGWVGPFSKNDVGSFFCLAQFILRISLIKLSVSLSIINIMQSAFPFQFISIYTHRKRNKEREEEQKRYNYSSSTFVSALY